MDNPLRTYWCLQNISSGMMMPMKNARLARACAIMMEETTHEEWRPIQVSVPERYWVPPTYPPEVGEEWKP